MANTNSNLPAALQNDFLTVPTDAELENFKLPDNTDLPYADEVKNAKLFSVTIRTTKSNPLNEFVHDNLSFDGNERAERDLIYQAYERVTGHEYLDPQEPLSRQGEGPSGNNNNFTYNIYGNALHNGLVKYRKSDLLGGESLYHMTRRLVTYLLDVTPDSYLGSLAGGKWWLAPDCYHIVVYHGRIQNGPNPASPSYVAIPISAAHFNRNPVLQDLYGMDRALDSGRFDNAQFTFHWINIQFYTYADSTKTEEKDATKDDHWGLVIRHAGTNDGYYFDSAFSDKDPAERAGLLQLVQTAINGWLQNSNKTPIARLQAPPNQPIQQQIGGEGLWRCGVHTIANVIAFIRCGRLGWHNVPTWRNGNGGRERDMVDEIRVSLHSLMGLRQDKSTVQCRFINTKKFSTWKKPATRRAYKVQVTEAAEDKEKQEDTDKQKDADTQTMETNPDSLRQQVASMKTDLIATLRQELDTVIQDQLRPVLQELQDLNPKGGDTSTTSQPPDMTVANLRQELVTVIQDQLRPLQEELQTLNLKGGDSSTTSQLPDMITAALRQELSTVIREELRPILREEMRPTLQEELRPTLQEELQNLNLQAGNPSTTNPPPEITAREQALDERERALNAREQAINREETLNQREQNLNERENDLKRKLDELEAGEESASGGGPKKKKKKTGHNEEEQQKFELILPKKPNTGTGHEEEEPKWSTSTLYDPGDPLWTGFVQNNQG